MIMNTNKILVASLATAMVVSMWITGTSAYGWGNGQWWGNWMRNNLSEEQKEQVQNMSMEERQEYMKNNWFKRWNGRWWNDWEKHWKWGKGWKWWEHNPGDMILDIPASDLTEKEKNILLYWYSEEMLARDIYNYLYELYWEEVFKRIADSEQKHMDAVEVLLNRYELDIPTGYDELQATFDELKSQGSEWLKEALEVGLQIEILDIEDIEDAIKNTDNEDFKVVFTNIWGASYNHLRWFLKLIDNNNFETDIDYSEFISEDDLDVKWPLKYKLAERLEEAWVDLPEQVSSEEMKNKKWGCDEHWKENWNEKNRRGNWKNNIQSNDNNWKRYAWANDRWNEQSLKNRYKNTLEKKYGPKIDLLDTVQLDILLKKVDDFSDTISNSSKYSDEIKEKYSIMLNVLRKMVLDRLWKNKLNLDYIFN